nr:MAG TPA: hypothetical protein [Caudoviricetes sp.]
MILHVLRWGRSGNFRSFLLLLIKMLQLHTNQAS